jgi:hypothetical protein
MDDDEWKNLKRTYHDWTVIIPRYKKHTNKHYYAWCRCKCGIQKAVLDNNLKSGQSKRCISCKHRNQKKI